MKKLMILLALFVPFQLAKADSHTTPNAVTADPDHYTVEFENDALRVVRINYGAGETSTMHAHDANCVVFLSGGEMTMAFPDGSSSPAPVSAAGEVNCSDAVVHLPTNSGDSNAEVIMFELKGRNTVE